MNVSTMGIINVMLFCSIPCCCGEVNLCWRNMVMPMRIGSTKYGSFMERSLIQNIKGAPFSSMVVLRTVKSAKNTGIWIIIGKHPENGLTPCFL